MEDKRYPIDKQGTLRLGQGHYQLVAYAEIERVEDGYDIILCVPFRTKEAADKAMRIFQR